MGARCVALAASLRAAPLCAAAAARCLCGPWPRADEQLRLAPLLSIARFARSPEWGQDALRCGLAAAAAAAAAAAVAAWRERREREADAARSRTAGQARKGAGSRAAADATAARAAAAGRLSTAAAADAAGRERREREADARGRHERGSNAKGRSSAGVEAGGTSKCSNATIARTQLQGQHYRADGRSFGSPDSHCNLLALLLSIARFARSLEWGQDASRCTGM